MTVVYDCIEASAVSCDRDELLPTSASADRHGRTHIMRCSVVIEVHGVLCGEGPGHIGAAPWHTSTLSTGHFAPVVCRSC